jgi:predicted ester cyclase
VEENIRSLLRREITPALYQRIRAEWTAHSIAEDARNIPGLLATLTEDCIYEVVQEEAVWHGHEGATRFYTQLLTAFPDVHFELRQIVIGPQGVWEEAHVTATHRADWLGHTATGRAVEFDVLIYFPWDERRQKFRGERVYYFGLE